jgi:hypothetical protein
MNCKTPVPAEKAKIFAAVFCCPGCYELAQRFEDRVMAELKRLQLMTREAIRIALTESRLELAPNAHAREPSKKEILEAIVKMVDVKERSARPDAEGREPDIR